MWTRAGPISSIGASSPLCPTKGLLFVYTTGNCMLFSAMGMFWPCLCCIVCLCNPFRVTPISSDTLIWRSVKLIKNDAIFILEWPEIYVTEHLIQCRTAIQHVCDCVYIWMNMCVYSCWSCPWLSESCNHTHDVVFCTLLDNKFVSNWIEMLKGNVFLISGVEYVCIMCEQHYSTFLVENCQDTASFNEKDLFCHVTLNE